MKVAIVHDYIKEYGGAERVLEALHEIWPEAPVYTSVFLPKFLGPHRDRFKSWEIRESWVRYIPFKEKLISPLRLIAPLLFRQFDFSEFDVVIVSATGAYNPNVIRSRCHPEGAKRPKDPLHESKEILPRQLAGQNDRKRRPIHICYCHTPPRYLYGYATAREWKKNLILRSIGELFNHFLRIVDFKSAQNVDYFIANSKEVAARIKKFYRREATVIYPPVEVARGPASARASAGRPAARPSKLEERSGVTPRYFLAGGRLARPKNIDLIVRACRELGVPLKVFGRGFGGYDPSIIQKTQNTQRTRGSAASDAVRNSDISDPQTNRLAEFSEYSGSIELLGEVTEEERYELMEKAKAYIFASEDEDFGITPVEAMATGTPVIAYKSGGVRESVIEGKTGIFFDELTMESLIRAIKQFDTSTIKPEACMKQAHKFSRERFQKEIKGFVERFQKK